MKHILTMANLKLEPSLFTRRSSIDLQPNNETSEEFELKCLDRTIGVISEQIIFDRF